MEQYTVDYFEKKFSLIPEHKWVTEKWQTFNGASCANGHCGVTDGDNGTPEAYALNQLLDNLTLTPPNNAYNGYWWGSAVIINDGRVKEYPQPTPKQRILAALSDVKKKQQEKYTVDYFISKFQAISESDWTDNAAGCAYTHCGQYDYGMAINPERMALSKLFETLRPKIKKNIQGTYHGYSWIVPVINDGMELNDNDIKTSSYPQKTPKERVLAALHDIKKIQEEKAQPKEPEFKQTTYTEVRQEIVRCDN